jgi:predicted O-methyltransferase YrrM
MLKIYLDFIILCSTQIFKKKTLEYKNIAIKVLKSKIKTKKFVKIEEIRKNLLKNNQRIKVIDLGAGSKKNKTDERRISDIAKNSLSSQKKCIFLYNIAEKIAAKNILEFGTSFGITTLYLASVENMQKITTVEASENIANIAKENFSNFNLNINLITDSFDNFIEKNKNDKNLFDLIFIDGNHQFQTTLRYFDYAIKHLSHKGVIIIDDIRWSKDMFLAWQNIYEQSKTGFFIDLISFGIIFNNQESKEKTCYLF